MLPLRCVAVGPGRSGPGDGAGQAAGDRGPKRSSSNVVESSIWGVPTKVVSPVGPTTETASEVTLHGVEQLAGLESPARQRAVAGVSGARYPAIPTIGALRPIDPVDP